MGSLHMTVKLRQVGRKFKTAAPSSPPFPTTSAVANKQLPGLDVGSGLLAAGQAASGLMSTA